MRLKKNTQYALLITIYLCRSGRSTISTISANLNIPKSFLYNLARKLVAKGILLSFKGVHGGFELNGNPTIQDIVGAVAKVGVISKAQQVKFSVGGEEARTLLSLTRSMDSALSVVFKRRIRAVGKELIANELKALDREGFSTLSN